MNRVLFFTFLLILFSSNSFSQDVIRSSHSEPPKWVNNQVTSETGDYEYITIMGEAQSLKAAKDRTHFNLLKQLASRDSLTISLIQEDKKQVVQQTFNDSMDFVEFYKNNQEMITKSTDISVHGIRKIEEYWELIEIGYKLFYHNYALYRKPKFRHVPPDAFDIPRYTFLDKRYSLNYNKQNTNYKIEGLKYRALIPGWGQLYKGRKGKAAFLFISSSITAAGLVVAQIQYVDNYNNAQTYRGVNYEFYQTYKQNYEDWNTIRMGCGIGFGVLYVYNLVDVLASRGERRFAFQPGKLKFIPYSDGENYLLTLNIAF